MANIFTVMATPKKNPIKIAASGKIYLKSIAHAGNIYVADEQTPQGD
jgi:hypothetical protein